MAYSLNNIPNSSVPLATQQGSNYYITEVWHRFFIDTANHILGNITLTGDVSGTGISTIPNTIQPNVVQYSKFQKVTAQRILGNPTGSLANVSEITLSNSFNFTSSQLTLSNTNVTPSTYGSATQVGQFTVNSQGQLTAASNIGITPAASSITGTGSLTKVDDTNVTLTLGGTPTGALLNPVSITAGWAGTLSSTRGGTGTSNPTAHTLPVAEGSSAFTFLGPLTNGQVLIGSTGVDPVAATLTAGSNVTITNGAGTITIAATSGSNLQVLAAQVFTSNGTYTPTSGMTYCQMHLIGAGGGGGGVSTAGASGNSSAAAGGGAGGYATRLFTSAQVGASATVTVSSSGGAGGTAGANTGTTGGNTSVALSGTGSITITANGGVGGTGAGNGTGTVAGGTGGSTSNGDITSSAGAPGDRGISLSASNFAIGGKGGDSIWGGGGPALGGTNNGATTGSTATGYGAGGGGAFGVQAGTGSAAGGAGSPGIVYIIEYCT